MSFIHAIHDPLTINLRRQTRTLLSALPPSSSYIAPLRDAHSTQVLLRLLSTYLAEAELTSIIATLFRPILLGLCARWLHDTECTEDQLVALCSLLEVHEELLPVLHEMLTRTPFKRGPLYFISTSSLYEIEIPRLHRLLLAYYRILQANRELPHYFGWPLTPLSCLVRVSGADNGVRLLAIRCYALQAGMSEAERESVEVEVLGPQCSIDCPIEYGIESDGTKKKADGWILPITELRRVQEARNAIICNPQDFYGLEEGDPHQVIQASDLSPHIVNVHGVLLYRTADSVCTNPSLITTPSTIQSLRALTLRISMRIPILLTSAQSAGKSTLLIHLANLLYPQVTNQIITIHLADTSLDPRSLLGSYVSSPTKPGTFEWQEGVLIRSMREGKWVVFKDIDRGSSEVLGVIKPLAESLRLGKWIGGRAFLEVPNRGRVVAAEGFALFATRSLIPSRNGKFPAPSFFGAHKFYEIIIPSPSPDDLKMIIDARYPSLAGPPAQAIICMWQAVVSVGSAASTRDIGICELEKFCSRVENLLSTSSHHIDTVEAPASLGAVFPNPTLREALFTEARDVFFSAGATTSAARVHIDSIVKTISEHFELEPDRCQWILEGRTPEFEVEKDVNGFVVAVHTGYTRLLARSLKVRIATPSTRPFALHRPALLLLSRISIAVSLAEPVLLTGETGTGKTSIITHLASLLRIPLISLNLSHQTESSDLLGGFKPVDARLPASLLQEQFLDLFGATFSRKKNVKFEESVRKAVSEGKWKRCVGLWTEAIRLAKDRIRSKQSRSTDDSKGSVHPEAPRKRRKVEDAAESVITEASWSEFEDRVREFEVQHVQAKGKFAFTFVEGPLVKALRTGDWILLDEINLASAETLECISGLLHGPTASITLTEQGALEPVPRHPDFRLFACMNPATDIGKKDLPPNIRSRFTEFDVPSPDADRETLLSIIAQYMGHCAVGDKAVILNIAEFYLAVRQLAESRQLADGSNRRPHYSMRTLTRALTFASDIVSAYGLRRAIWEGCFMAFTMVLDASSAEVVTTLAQKHLLAGVRNPRSMLTYEPTIPLKENYVKFGPFYLEKGPLLEDAVDDYIITPSVEKKLVDLARIILTRRFPVLIEGPTSSGKTSSIEYLAKRTGHQFIRINNHEHTDIQEYLGSYVSDPSTGKLVFKDGLLVRALRNGHWIVLDELNLAPTDVLEALNRLLDDNRELLLPETHEVVKPHPHFMLFATQNPPGLYAGRKALSRAFRNRFLEVHFEDVPQEELESILCQRCRIAPSYGKRIVSVFLELQKRRQSTRVFESKHGFATLRDLFRWADRDAIGYQELADNGYMLLAERTRRDDDKAVVKEVIESVMGVKINEKALYDFRNHAPSYLDCQIPNSDQLVWTSAMQRLFTLVARALRFNEPVLLVGETGSGKTSVCQAIADILHKHLHTVSCHQNTETADLIGGLRPVRNRGALEADAFRQAAELMQSIGISPDVLAQESLLGNIDQLLRSLPPLVTPELKVRLEDTRLKLLRLQTIFEWQDGPLVQAMRSGAIFLLDEISLADDSVLERLNSVLEPSRTLVLAERGGDQAETAIIRADEGFKLVATMNPGGDYGKKELSPALRNRFTEIWVPPVEDRQDLELIIGGLWKHESLKPFTTKVLDFLEWFCRHVGDRSILSLRDIIAWVNFSNSVCDRDDKMPVDEIFHHAAHMTLLDGLGSLPHLSSYSPEQLNKLRQEMLLQLHETVLLPDKTMSYVPVYEPPAFVQLGSFAVSRGPHSPHGLTFNLQAPTTRDNALRIVRAMQVSKPILLEGSPGVGKTSLVTALANLCGHTLCRINLSDQTDLIDLFGSDLPVEGGGRGEFAWKDAELLVAMQNGHWVLLDEMNLAPQAILEGLNAILDHRGTVYVPELDRSFTRHPQFRIFAAQNPLSQGGGRKGLPKSFVNRFTKVYVEELSPNDMLLVSHHLFPQCDTDTLRAMIAYNSHLNEEVTVQRMFANEGAPWEFNLRDIIRWGNLIHSFNPPKHPLHYLRTVYLHRFRRASDRERARRAFERYFPVSTDLVAETPPSLVTPSQIQIGCFSINRKNFVPNIRPSRLLLSQIPVLESLGHCVKQSWLSILTGPRNSGKTEVVRLLASLTGNVLREVHVNSATDTMDILGSFEQFDFQAHVTSLLHRVKALAGHHIRTKEGLYKDWTACFDGIQEAAQLPSNPAFSGLHLALRHIKQLGLETSFSGDIQDIDALLGKELVGDDTSGRFEWVDGPLVRAAKEGHWLLIDDANLCNPSVLDRLNSLCEPDGNLTLGERGYVGGELQVIKPHPNFHLFMLVDPQYGELSRAMRNRGVEVAFLPDDGANNNEILRDYLRLPLSGQLGDDFGTQCLKYAALRSGIYIEQKEPTVPIVKVTTSGRALDLYSTLSTFTDGPPAIILRTQQIPTDSLLFFHARTAIPSLAHYLMRFRTEIVPYSPIFAHLVAFSTSHLQSKLATLFEKAKHLYGQNYGVSSSVTDLQAIDTILNTIASVHSVSSLEETIHILMLHVLDLSVALFIEQSKGSVQLPRRTDSRFSEAKNMRALEEINVIVNAVHALSESILEQIDLKGQAYEEQLTDLNIAFRLLQYTNRLRQAVATSFDYSSVQAISQWFSDLLLGCGPRFSTLVRHVNVLKEVMSISSGFGLVDIWSSLSVDLPSTACAAQMDELNAMTYRLQVTPRYHGIRCRTLELMALRSLSVTQGEGTLSTLVERLKEQLTETESITHEYVNPVAPCLILAELKIVSRWPALSESSKNIAYVIHEISDLTCSGINLSLRRLVSYQHLSWAIITKKDPTLSAIADSHRRWLHALWDYPDSDRQEASSYPHRPSGPDAILSPTYLFAAALSPMVHNTLSTIADHDLDLRHQTRLLSLELIDRNPRLHHIATFLQSSLYLICSCFSASYNAVTTQEILETSLLLPLAQIDTLLSLVSQTRNTELRSALEYFLRPPFKKLKAGCTSRFQTIAALGAFWIALGQLSLHLFVPDAPIDPATIHNLVADDDQHAAADLKAQVLLHAQLEQCRTGNKGSAILRHLNDRLQAVSSTSSSVPNHLLHREVSRLHMFWSEIRQFQQRIVSSSTSDSYLSLLEAGHQEAVMREQVTQQSMMGFCQRMDTAYPEFSDLGSFMDLAVQQIRLGLRFVAYSANHDDHVSRSDSEFVHALVAFPSVRCTTKLREASSSQLSHPFRNILLNVSAIAMEKCQGVDVARLTPHLQIYYEQAFHLWKIDRAKDSDKERASQSLYRSKNTSHEPTNEAELEEQEFLALFPSFEQALEPEASSLTNDKPSNTHLVDTSDARRFVDAHCTIFGTPDSASTILASQAFKEIRSSTLIASLQVQTKGLFEDLDIESQPLQLDLLHDRFSRLRHTTRDKPLSYNFYTDLNIPEANKCAEVIKLLKGRLELLIQEWPDQVVLQNLKARCDSMLGLDLESPIAKLLAALEHILAQSEDWEIYAHRGNSLKPQQQAMIALIVEWRRLELSCWQGILRSQAKSFADAASDWWFQLYGAVVRGPLDIVEKESHTTEELTAYMQTLVPLLDNLISSSPLGQFHARLGLLQTFKGYVESLASTMPGSTRSALEMLHRILHATDGYFSMSTTRISERLAEQKVVLEKEVHDLIKLASWKDINVHALKQSAQRTHHQLFKIVRKFRDILRQPILDLLCVPMAGTAEAVRTCDTLTIDSSVIRPQPVFPAAGSILQSPHLANLDQTHSRFRILLESQIKRSIQSYSADVLDRLATEIITTAEDFASTTVTGSSTAQREKQLKALLTRKRKAWSDLLKELKRSGLAPTVKPDVLRQQADALWIRNQPVLPTSGHPTLPDCDKYFCRLYGCLPDTRQSLVGHHSDLTTRELHRGMMFLESGFSIAIEARSSLAGGLYEFQKLKRTVRRLNTLQSCPVVVACGLALASQLNNAKDVFFRLISALKEVVHHLQVMAELPLSVKVPDDFALELNNLLTTTEQLANQLVPIVQDVCSTTHPILLTNEHAIVQAALQHLTITLEFLRHWGEEQVCLAHVLQPVQAWLTSVSESLAVDVFKCHSESATYPADDVIDALLIVVQNLLQLSPATQEDERPDNYLRDHLKVVCNRTHRLAITGVLDLLDRILPSLSASGPDVITNNLLRLIPFLEEYVQLAETQLFAHSQWNKAIFKLVYVVCAVIHTLATKGFCKPSEADESSANGESLEVTGGVGFGEGSGSDNISKELEEEHQVEGLQREEADNPDDRNRSDDSNAVEMSEDFKGDMEDVPDQGSLGDESEDDGEADLEERMDQLDKSDPGAVDEKLWGDESGPRPDEGDDKTQQESSSKAENSEMVAKEGKPVDKPEKEAEELESPAQEKQAHEQETSAMTDGETAGDEEEPPNASGAPMDDHVNDAEALDLPTDIDFGPEDDNKANLDGDVDMDDDDDTDQVDDIPALPEDTDGPIEEYDTDVSKDTGISDNDHLEGMGMQEPADAEPDTTEDDLCDDQVIGNADYAGGGDDDMSQSDKSKTDKESDFAMQNGSGEGGKNEEAMNKEQSTDRNCLPDNSYIKPDHQDPLREAGSAPMGSIEGHAPAEANAGITTNPLRSLAEAMKEIQKRLDDILDPAQHDATQSRMEDSAQPTQIEYAQPDDDHNMQALGPAGETQIAKLNELNIVDNEQASDEAGASMDIDPPIERPPDDLPYERYGFESDKRTSAECEDIASAVTGPSRSSGASDPFVPPSTLTDIKADTEMVGSDVDVEAKLRDWQAHGQSEDGAEKIWHLYESLTSDLAYALCEQLRLILEPTLATRLKGDYRTGKRLNMKKVISYIASDFTKDKIWLRRTRPSQREYQILIALDDSRSMAESHSVHLAFQTLALVSKALSRLEAGDIGIAKFGAEVDILHAFDQGPFTAQAGTKVLSAFRFNQKATNVLSLVTTSLATLEAARERRAISSSTAADLWQLEIIISDGICQDHDKLRSILRKAEEQKVMIVFIIIDSLRSTTPNFSQTGSTPGNSILSMEKAAFKSVDGRMELQLERYLDSFPFEYYVVLRNVEALPDVLAGTLKQFFERISEE